MTKDWVHGGGHSPVRQILLQIVVRAVITSSAPAWTDSARTLSTPADFPFFNVQSLNNDDNNNNNNNNNNNKSGYL